MNRLSCTAYVSMIAVGIVLLNPRVVQAQVGIIRTVEGQVSVFSGKQECAPRYGLDLEEGDAVRTGAKAWALLAMMDGAKITVRPDTEVRIDAYRYTDAGESAQNRAQLTLTQGALRVTSARIIAGRNAGFSIQLPDASMELRGADHDVAFVGPKFATRDTPAGSYGKSHAGDALMKSPHGEVIVRAGQVAYAEPRVRASPRVLSIKPYFYHWHDHIDRRAAAIAEKLDLIVP